MGRVDQAQEREAMIAFAKGESYHQEALADGLRSLSEAVVSIHYPTFPERTELVSIGIDRAISLLKAPFFDPRKNIRGFLYTGIRNEVGNHLRKEARSVAVPSSLMHLNPSPFEAEDVLWEIEFEKRYDEIRDRFRACGVMDDQYHNTSRGAALYRAIL